MMILLPAVVCLLRSVMIAPVPIDELTRTADAVVVGKLTGVRQAGVSTYYAQIVTTRVVKGDLLPGSIMHVLLPKNFSTAPEIGADEEEGETLWFMRSQGQGQFETIPSINGGWSGIRAMAIPVAPEKVLSQFASIPQVTPLDRVVVEVAAGTLEHRGPRSSLGSLFARMGQLHSPVLVSALSVLSKSGDASLRVQAFTALVGQGDLDALTAALRLVDSGQMPAREASRLIANLAEQIHNRYANMTPAGVATLAGVAMQETMHNVIRQAAAFCLANMHTRESLPYLAQLLDSDDLEMRSYGVGGLAMFANNEPPRFPETRLKDGDNSMLHGPYTTDATIAHSAMGIAAVQPREAELIAFWKAWWAQHRAELQQP